MLTTDIIKSPILTELGAFRKMFLFLCTVSLKFYLYTSKFLYVMDMSENISIQELIIPAI